MDNSANVSRARGRKPTREQIDFIAAQMWAAAVRLRAGVSSFYAVDKLIWPDRFRRHREAQENWSVTPCRFAAYARGKAVPNEETVARVEELFPGCRQWLHLPLYEIVRPGITRERLHDLLRGLRPGVVDRLFYPAAEPAKGYGGMKPIYDSTLRILSRESDLDAMTACFGIAVESRFAKHEYLTHYAVNGAYAIFLRYITTPPWDIMRYMWFDYLRPRFWVSTNPFTGKPLDMSEDRFEFQFYGRAKLVDMMEELGLLRHDYDRHRACICLADQGNYRKLLTTLEKYLASDHPKEAKADPFLKTFAKRVARIRLFRDPLFQSAFGGFPKSDAFRYKVQLVPAAEAGPGFSRLPKFKIKSNTDDNGKIVHIVPV